MNVITKRNNWFLGNNGHLTWLGIWLILAVAAMIFFLFLHIGYLTITGLFVDEGAGLKADYLISKGLIPGIDFSYSYGLLPLIVGNIWYEIFGRTPQAFCGLMFVFNLLSVAAMAKIAFLADLKFIGIIFLAVTIPYSFLFSNGLNPTHVMEPFFICLALSEQLAGRKQYALLVLIFGWFTKPSMSIVYIFLLLLTYLFDIYTKKISVGNFIYQLRFPFLTFVALITLVGINFGITPSLSSLFPLNGSQVYKESGFGFFNAGRGFWGPSGAKITYYLGSGAGFWIFLTVLLILSVFYFYYNNNTKFKNEKIKRITELQLTILCLHLSFIFLFYGSSGSWGYYAYLPIIGVSLIASRSIRKFTKFRIFLISFVIVLAILAYYGSFLKGTYKAWHFMKPQGSIIGLWSQEDEKNAFTDLVNSCKNKNTLIYGPGAVDLFFPSCHMPETFYPVLDANLNKRELDKIKLQFDQAHQIVVLNSFYPDITKLPKLKLEFDRFEIDHKDKMFTYLRRKN